MRSLLEFTTYADAHKHYSREAVAALFDGSADAGCVFNLAHECVDRHAARANAAIRVLLADDGVAELGFRELSALSSRVAHWLAANGVAAGDRVAVMLEPGVAFCACVFGILKLGAVVVPLFPLFGAQAIEERVQDARPRILFTSTGLAAAAEKAAAHDVRTVIADDGLLQHLQAFDAVFEPRTTPADPAVRLYTSGTTRARPSAVEFSHRALLRLMPSVLYGEGLRPGDTLFCPSSSAWGHGFWYGLIAPLAFGITACTLAGRFQADRMLHAMKAFHVDTLAAAPTVFRMLMNSGLAWDGPRLRKISYSGESMDVPTALWVEQAFGAPPCSMYGTTEVGVVLGNYPGAADHVVKPGSLGKPFPGSRIEVLGAGDIPCAPGVIGEIKIWRAGRWLATRDLGHVDEDGYFFHDGRADDVIISSGWTMSAVEIEDTLRQHELVREAAVIGVPDSVRGQVPKAYVIPREAGSERLAFLLQQFVRERLGAHEYPRIVEFVADIPITPAGKINRKALRELNVTALEVRP